MQPTLAILNKISAAPLYLFKFRNGPDEFQTIDSVGWNLAFENGELGETVLEVTETKLLIRQITQPDKEAVRDSKSRFSGWIIHTQVYNN